MKLRCRTNSIRFRLRKSDVRSLMENSKLKDSIHFPNGTSFVYGIVLTDHETGTYCENNYMLIELKRSEIRNWVNSDDVSFQIKLSTIGDQTLSILIEKDFPCKHTGDDYDDTYHELQPEEYKMYRKDIVSMN